MPRFIDKYIADKTMVEVSNVENCYYGVDVLERDNDFICIKEQHEIKTEWLNINHIYSIKPTR